jgi:predicted GIY-YIG superfamily endonuclease
MPDYSNGKIYKLVSDKTAMIYIGSTTQDLNERLSGHKNEFKNI